MFGTGVFFMNLPLASLIGGFLAANMVDKGIVLVQSAALLAALGLAAGKFQETRAFLRGSRSFLREFLAGRDVLDYYLLGQKDSMTMTSLERIYDRTCDRMVKLLEPEAKRAVMGGRKGEAGTTALSGREVDLVRSTCLHALREEKLRVARGMGTLAAAAVAAPARGLLGTVWGVLDALAAAAAQESCSLASVAPALASALVTLVVGLSVAFPCAFLFFGLSARLRQLRADMDGFADELMCRIACEFQGRNA